jgi:hypothetical protein
MLEQPEASPRSIGVWVGGHYLSFPVVRDRMTGRPCVADPRGKPSLPKAQLREARLEAVTKAKAAGLLG